MRIEKSTLERLGLQPAAQSVTSSPMDRMPLLPTDRCLAAAAPTVRSAAISAYSTGMEIASETLTMPRGGFGPRPINIIETPARALYEALTEALRPSLPEETRGKGKWSAFSSVGMLESNETYVVELDIASCYEYIDHPRLHQELLLQTMNVEVADGVTQLLGEIFGRPRGLPQLLQPSDLLSDTYLTGIERALLRAGYETARFADDFKVLAGSWGEANDIIENAADIARDFGLVLSSAKTVIRKSGTVRDQRQRLVTFLADYFDAARDDLTTIDIFSGPYEDFEEVETEPSDREALEAAFWRILTEWESADEHAEMPFHSHHLPIALSYLESAVSRIADHTLVQITFSRPLHLQAVLNYVVARADHGENWRTLAALVAMERQSPWAKLWLLDTAEKLLPPGGDDERAVFVWARRQLLERHETVRASAAWLLGLRGLLTEDDLRHLSASATGLSRPLLAAATSTLGLDTKFARSLKTHSPLAREASSWAESRAT